MMKIVRYDVFPLEYRPSFRIVSFFSQRIQTCCFGMCNFSPSRPIFQKKTKNEPKFDDII